jgi:hypothetical protein
MAAVAFTFFCLAIGVQAGVPISTPPVGPTSRTVGWPSLAPAGDGFLAFWPEDFHTLQAVPLDKSGRPRGSVFALAQPGSAFTGPRVASDGLSAYVLWQTYAEDPPSTRHAARVDADGKATVFSDLSVPVTYMNAAMAIAAGGGNVMLVYADDDHTLTVTLFDRDGRLLRSRVPVAHTGESGTGWDRIDVLDVAYAGGDAFLITWVDMDAGTRVLRVSAGDVLSGNVFLSPFAKDSGFDAGWNPRVVSDGTHSMLFWDYAGLRPTLQGRLVSSSGVVLGNGPLVFGDAYTGGLSLSTSADGYRILAQDSLGILQVRLFFDGVVSSFTHAPLFGSLLASSFSAASLADGTTLGIAVDGSQQRSEIAVSPINADGTAGTGTIVSLGPPAQSVLALQPWRGGAAALWLESSANDHLMVGRFSATGTPLDGAGLQVTSSTAAPKTPAMGANDTQLLVAWTESTSGNAAKLYAALVPFDGFAVTPSVRELANDAATDSGTAVVWNGTTFTVVYQRTGTRDLAARRVDTAGNVVDSQPVALTPPRSSGGFADANPQLSWNGHDYLLVWQRQAHEYSSNPEAPPFLTNQLFAQRFDAALTASGAETALATRSGNATAVNQQITLSRGIWLASWLDSETGATYARIDATGTRLDPLNGRSVAGLSSRPFVMAAPDGWLVVGSALATARIALDGTASPAVSLPMPFSHIESLSAAPLPLFTYKIDDDPLAYIDTLPQHRRVTAR